MQVLPTVLGVVAGICGYVGALHLLVGRRRAQRNLHLTFALLCFCIVGVALATAALYQAQTVAMYTRALKWQQTFIYAAVVPLLWFVAFATGAWLRVFLVGMSGVAAFALAINLAAPFGIFFTHIGDLTSRMMWWGERIPLPAAAIPGRWELFLQVSFLALLLYSAYACAHQYRRGERTAAIQLGLGLAVLFAARIYDRANLFHGTPGHSLMVYGFLALIVVMSLGFLNDLIVMAIIRERAEAGIRALNLELEQRVVQRTAELQAANRQLRQQRHLAERRRRVAEHLSDLLDLLNAGRPLEEMWAAICAATRGLFETQATAVYQCVNGTGTLLAAAGERGALAAEQSSIQYLFSHALAAGYPQVIEGTIAHPMLPSTATQRELEHQALLAIPLLGSDFSGMLLLANDHERSFTTEDIALATALGDQVALAIDNAHLRRQVAVAAVAEERNRLARELHDSVTQSLYAASLMTETLPVVWNRNAAEGMHTVAKVHQLVLGALAEMRTLLFELRPAALVTAELGTLLRQLGEVLTGRTRIPVELIIEGQVVVPTDVKIAIYRIAQEALNNIARHAGATQVGVTFRALPEGLVLAVRDDGRGFDPTVVPGDRMGLRIMAERAAGIGARLVIDSAPQRGTEVAVRWPDR